jgi:hypothetical protein
VTHFSRQSLRENVARLQQYKANLIVFPKKRNRGKPQSTDSSKDELSKAEQVLWILIVSLSSILIGNLIILLAIGYRRRSSHRQGGAGHLGIQDHPGGQGQESLLHAPCGSCRFQAHWQACGNHTFSFPLFYRHSSPVLLSKQPCALNEHVPDNFCFRCVPRRRPRRLWRTPRSRPKRSTKTFRNLCLFSDFRACGLETIRRTLDLLVRESVNEVWGRSFFTVTV